MREKIFHNLSLQCADLLERGRAGGSGGGVEREREIYEI